MVLTHKDRLLRFGSELVFAIGEEFEVEVVIINRSVEEISFKQELALVMIEQGIVESISQRHVRRLLTEATLKPHQSEYWLNPPPRRKV